MGLKIAPNKNKYLHTKQNLQSCSAFQIFRDAFSDNKGKKALRLKRVLIMQQIICCNLSLLKNISWNDFVILILGSGLLG